MRLVTVFLIAAFAASTVDAASYQKRDGTILDPIMNYYYSEPLSCSGANLEPYADLTGANLALADLTNANLSDAKLTDAKLTGGDLSGANLEGANLNWADLTGVNLTNANLSGANLSGLYWHSATFGTGTILRDGQTVGQHGFDTAGLEAYLR
jgi:uncharacterized protein YjbI with pentapeptide repeats